VYELNLVRASLVQCAAFFVVWVLAILLVGPVPGDASLLVGALIMLAAITASDIAKILWLVQGEAS